MPPPSTDYPRMLFHRHKEPVTVQTRDEENALGPEWSRRIWPPEPAPTLEPEAEPEPEEEAEPAPEPEEETPAAPRRRTAKTKTTKKH